MKKIRANIDRYLEKLDDRWQALPVRKQRKYTMYFFVCYLLLTIGVVFKVYHDTGKSGQGMVIEHIENPILEQKNTAILQDSLQEVLKNKIYER
jgi:hypothetical protein